MASNSRQFYLSLLSNKITGVCPYARLRIYIHSYFKLAWVRFCYLQTIILTDTNALPSKRQSHQILNIQYKDHLFPKSSITSTGKFFLGLPNQGFTSHFSALSLYYNFHVISGLFLPKPPEQKLLLWFLYNTLVIRSVSLPHFLSHILLKQLEAAVIVNVPSMFKHFLFF